MSIQTQLADNGVNVQALLTAREALTDNTEAAQFQWRVSNSWVKGTHSQSKVERYYGLGEEQQHRQQFEYQTDHPEIFAADDNGATPVEMVMVGLAGCLSAGIASVAQNRNIQLNSVEASIEGDMDIQGILGIDSKVRNGFNNIRVVFDIDADASDDDIQALVAQSQKRSAVFDALANPTLIAVTVK